MRSLIRAASKPAASRPSGYASFGCDVFPIVCDRADSVEVSVRCLFAEAALRDSTGTRRGQHRVRAAGRQPEYPVAVRPIEVAIGGHRQTVWRLLQNHLVVGARLADPEKRWVRVAVAPAGCDVQKAIGPFDHAREEVAVEIAVRVVRIDSRPREDAIFLARLMEFERSPALGYSMPTLKRSVWYPAASKRDCGSLRNVERKLPYQGILSTAKSGTETPRRNSP